MTKRAKTTRLDDLVPAPYNPRDIDSTALEALKASLGEFGDISGITWNRRTGHLVTGHQRLRSLREVHGDALRMRRGIIETPDGVRFVVRVVDWSIDKERAANIAANSPLLGGFFTGGLAELVELVEGALPDLSEALRLDDLLDALGMAEVQDLEEDEVPEPPAKAVSRLGDLWTLGDHLALCGDATEHGSYAALNRRAVCMWTDPPYGVSYQGKTKDALTIENDKAEGLAELLAGAFAQADDVLEPGAAVYVAHPAGAQSVTFGMAFVGQGWRLHQTLVWVKDSMVLGHCDYHYRHEPILYGYKAAESGRRGRGAEGWYGGHSETTVFEFPSPRVNREHPTGKPVRLVATMLKNSTQPGDDVVDPFLGSGSTLVAAEQLGRRAFGCELDPRYCDVIVERWQNLTGGKARRRKEVVS